jgi:8-oxo-dGTP pyrophosphatase MutT (NUDIX family)
MGGPKQWRVSGGIVRVDGELLMVANRRRDNSVDWTPPGGVVDPGETPVGALTREVFEETGLTVSTWSVERYSVHVDFVDMGMHLTVGVFEATEFSGEVNVGEDPDGIVFDAAFVDRPGLDTRLANASPWVREPLLGWLDANDGVLRRHRYEAAGVNPTKLAVRSLPAQQP